MFNSQKAGLCAAVFAILVMSTVAFGQTKQDDIMRLLRVSGTDKTVEQVVDAMLAQFRQMPGVPASFWDGFKRKLDLDAFLRTYVAIYDKHYTHDDIRQLIAFYESPIGRKMVAVTPAMLQESMTAGQQWGEQIAAELMRELNAAGISPR